MNTRVMIADDHAVIIHGLKRILASATNINVVDEAQNFQEMKTKLKVATPDVLVMDMSMPGGDGIDVLKEIKRDFPRMPILVLSMHSEDQYALRSIKAGASGYLTKECAPEQLVSAIGVLAKGDRYLTPAVMNLISIRQVRDETKPLHLDLSDREFQVMLMIGAGETLTGISKKFELSIKTISTYRNRILKKMGMKNNADIIRYVIAVDLLSGKISGLTS